MITEGFIDGDLVERFLDFSQTQMDEVCKGLKVKDFAGHMQCMWEIIKVSRLVGSQAGTGSGMQCSPQTKFKA
jgi:UDP-N-acetylglucosamine transferase subunit ALG13